MTLDQALALLAAKEAKGGAGGRKSSAKRKSATRSKVRAAAE
jgi:hypothetical protein